MNDSKTNFNTQEMHTNSKLSDLRAGHVAIRTQNYKDLIEWYVEKLDFRIIGEWVIGEMQLAFIAASNDDNFILEILGIEHAETQPVSQKRAGYDHICFNVNDLDSTVSELKSRNIDILRSFDVPDIGIRVMFISDPYGNAIEFCEKIRTV